jgi:hypothetical protein
VNAFIGKPEQPTAQELAAELGGAAALWDGLVARLAREHGVTAQEWNSYSRKAGWALRLKHGKRAIVYLSPCRGWFFASFALGEKALEAARRGGLPRPAEGKRYAEGTAVRIDVRAPEDVDIVTKVAAAKLEN